MTRTRLPHSVLLGVLLLTCYYPSGAQVVASNAQTVRQMARPVTTPQTLSLRDVLTDLRTRYGVDILFEDRIVVGQVILATAIEAGVTVEKLR